jgi:hypothetical protein
MPLPTITDLLQTMRDLAFIVESVAHLQRREELLIHTEKAREQIRQVEENLIIY